MNIVFGPIYPYTFGTWVGVAFWWLGILSIAAAIVIALRMDKEDTQNKGGDHGT